MWEGGEESGNLSELTVTQSIDLATVMGQRTRVAREQNLLIDEEYRMARMEKVSPEMLQLIERSMWSEDLTPSQGLSASGGPQAVAAILNTMPASLEKQLMDGVHRRDAGLCEQIRNLMFVFEDILTIDARSIQRVLREVDGKELALALKGASAELQEKIMSAMSQRAIGSLKEEMEMLGPARKRDIEASQTGIVAMIRKLEDAGEIVVGGGADDLVA